MPMYLAEISSIKIRGSISVLTIVVLKVGVLFMYVIGQYLTISQVGWLSTAFPIAFFLLFFWCPESPYYLLVAKKPDDAYKCLVQLRGHSDVQQEFENMQSMVKANQLNRPTYRELVSKQNQQSLLLIIALTTVAQLNGANSVMAYAEIIFDHIDSDFSPGYTTMILGVVQLVASVCGSIFMDRFGRRRIMFISILASAICNGILVIYFLLQESYDLSSWTWLGITIVMVLSAFAVFGMITLPMVILGEIFPKHLKGIAANVMVMSASAAAFMMAKLFQIITDSLGYAAMFGMFTVVCVVFTPFFWYKLPETKGKSFQEILDELHEK